MKGRTFLSPHMGIASLFIIPRKNTIKSLIGYKYNKGYLEWYIDDKYLENPLEYVHMTHNVKEITDIEKGFATGFIYTIDISNIKDKLELFDKSNDPNREVIYNGNKPLNVINVTKHSLK